MPEENTQHPSTRARSRKERVEFARSRDILDVANELHMELVRSGRDYRWKEHDSLVITPSKNLWKWYSRNEGGDVITLVEVIKELDFNQAIDFLNDGSFREFTAVKQAQEPFSYYLQPYEQPFDTARSFLRDKRGLSDETIDFFFSQGVLAQANAKINDSIEPVVVFKSLDFSGEIVGATLQGIEENWKKWPKRGYAKNIIRNSDGITGMHVDIGTPNRLVFAESAIDLMSYYELNKDRLQDVRLISMDGLKEGMIGRHLAQLQSELSGRPIRWSQEQLAEGLQIAIDNGFFADGKHADWITLAVDNDNGGRTFIETLQEKGATITPDLPELSPGQDKADWNDVLRNPPVDNSRLGRAEIEYLSTVARKDLPANIQANENVQELLGLVEELGQTAYFWVTEEDLGQPEKIVSQIDNWFSSGKVDEGYTSERFELMVGDNTYMIAFKDGNLSLQNMEDFAKYISEQIDTAGLEAATSELEAVIADFNQVKESITVGMDKQIESLKGQLEITSYRFNGQEYSDFGAFIEVGSTYLQSPDGQNWMSHDPEYHQKLKMTFESDTATPKQKLEVMSEFGQVQVNGYDILAGLAYSDALSDDARYLILDAISEIDNQRLSENLGLHQEIEDRERSSSLMKTYDEVKLENEDLVKRLENRIKDGELAISFDTDVYLYDVFAKLGNSHPFKYLNDKRLEVLAPLQPLLASIDENTVDFYKNKGTLEQDALYQALVPHQRTLGVDISTRFIGELAIAAYSTNKQLESLSAEHFGSYYGARTFDNLSQSIERILEYPLNETGIKDYTYGFVTTPNAFYHFLEEQEGDLVLSRSELNALLSRLEERPIQILDSIQEDAVAVSDEKEKSPEMTQETISELGQQKNAEGTIGDFPENQEAAPLPEVNVSQPLNDLSPSQTQPQPLLYFSINEDGQSINKRHYHAISNKELVKLNRYAGTLQQAANWYLNELADSKIYYFYQENDSTQTLQVLFDKDKFQHLTGVFPYKEGQSAEQTLEDFANGNGAFDTILLANKGAAFDKLKVLPELPAIVESDSFYFGDLSEVQKLHSLDLDKAIKSGDEDIILALRTVDNTTFPASLMKLRTGLKNQLAQSAEENIVLGVYRERAGQIDQLSINEEYVKDGGQEMLSILENKQYEEALEPTQEIVNNDEMSAELFTQVLDAAYNVGDPRNIGVQVPEESKAAWERYYELSDSHEGNFSAVVAAADQLSLVDKNSNFYQEWKQDQIYNEEYHVRLNWSDRGPDGVQLPFKAGELIEYKDFVTTLYRGNQEFEVKFDVYAPGGRLIKDNIHYDIGDETEPVSRLLGLGYRRLEGQAELAQLDELVLSQLENESLNHELAKEANEQLISFQKSEATPQEQTTTETTTDFVSQKQVIKDSLSKQVEKITKQESHAAPSSPEEEFDYSKASAFEISERALQKIREYTQSPEGLKEYMDFMSKFPQLSPRNVALIQEQWPGANAVATFDQWKSMGEALGIGSEDVIQTKKVFTNKRTGETKEVVQQSLSVKTGEKAHITLFRPLISKMIPVLDDRGNQVQNDKGNPKFKKLSEATPQEKAMLKEGKLKVSQFQERDIKTGQPRFTTYKVFELSQTTLKPESYPKAMPNRHFNYDMDQVQAKEVLDGLCDYAKSIGVTIMQDDARLIGNAKGVFSSKEQLILLNPDNTPGERIGVTIHELAHATLHNPSRVDSYQADLPRGQKELEAEMTSYLVSKHFGLDTSEQSIQYMSKWTKNLEQLDDKQLAQSLKRIHKTVSQLHKHVEAYTKPHQVIKQRGKQQNFSQAQMKGLRH